MMRLSVRRLTYLATFSLLTLALSYLESLVPLGAFIPVPGFKLGLANLIVVLLIHQDSSGAFAVMVLKVVLSAVLFGTPTTFLFSVSGGILSFLGMLLAQRIVGKQISNIGLCAIGGVLHNAGQLLITSLYFELRVALSYATPMLFSGVFCGTILGVVLNLFSERITKTLAKIHP